MEHLLDFDKKLVFFFFFLSRHKKEEVKKMNREGLELTTLQYKVLQITNEATLDN